MIDGISVSRFRHDGGPATAAAVPMSSQRSLSKHLNVLDRMDSSSLSGIQKKDEIQALPMGKSA
ncbi:hypothetical protein [Burkholderia pseudomallei]|uniref:hypothetical protein n=1 Tax=Burkholderia pseudomallei TaxID=28450 RepID=UPI0012B89D6E|nr:hypothetical protein [Burkholderia pseudomallei]